MTNANHYRKRYTCFHTPIDFLEVAVIPAPLSRCCVTPRYIPPIRRPAIVCSVCQSGIWELGCVGILVCMRMLGVPPLTFHILLSDKHLSIISDPFCFYTMPLGYKNIIKNLVDMVRHLNQICQFLNWSFITQLSSSLRFSVDLFGKYGFHAAFSYCNTLLE